MSVRERRDGATGDALIGEPAFERRIGPVDVMDNQVAGVDARGVDERGDPPDHLHREARVAVGDAAVDAGAHRVASPRMERWASSRRLWP